MLALCCLHSATAAVVQTSAPRSLDDFESLAPWQAQHTDDVSASLRSAAGKVGKALQLDFDFTDAHGHPINGYATARRALPLDLPGNYELSFWIRGDAPVNTFQFKLVDTSGANVWWYNRPDFTFSRDWQQIRIKKRQIEFAWGPTQDKELRHSASIEFVVSSGRDGGKGSVEIDDLTLRELPPPDSSPLQPRLSASSTLKGFPATAAKDGDARTAWRSDPAHGIAPHLDLDFGKPREFGGLVLHWRHGEAPDHIDVQASADGRQWRKLAAPRARNGDDDALLLTETETHWLRLDLHCARGCGLDELEVEDLAWGATPNAFFVNVAKSAPRGRYPRGFVEQSYWTIVGVDGGPMPALLSEDGALQPGQAGFSIEPLLNIDGAIVTWAEVEPTQSLHDGYLPIPRVEWKSGNITLAVTAFATGTRARSQLVADYELRNDGDTPRRVDLALALRPFQVNPPMQFLNTPGGVAPIHDLAWDGGGGVVVDGKRSIVALTPPAQFIATSVESRSIVEQLGETLSAVADHGASAARGGSSGVPTKPHSHANPPLEGKGFKAVHDDSGYASGALVYRFDLPPHGGQRVALVAPLTGEPQLPSAAAGADAWVDAQLEAAVGAWRERLDRVQLTLPQQAQRLADTLRTAHAHILMSRDGPTLRPGTRSYARSWIRDGAMIADALLRLGDIDAVRDYVDWYAPHQFANGKVPCCVDHRGSDPVPENDSHGELIHAIAQLYRYTGDRAGLEKSWPHVDAATGYMDALRASETGAGNPAFKGLLPASISHEGYSAKPMHSYWDDFWALTGYKDAGDIAQALGRTPDARRIAQARDDFRRDLYASIESSVRTHAIDYLPGCAELGDFDATSATVALAPGGELANVPDSLLRNAFARYWRFFAARADGSAPWQDYTPYEWRTVGSFVRLGERAHAQSAIDFFYATGARPLAWNQWAEVVDHDPRKPRFIGDMPHAWVESDFIRSVLDLFAYERSDDRSLVLAAGVPDDWLSAAGIGVDHLHTPYGELSYRLRRDGRRLVLHIDAGAAPPGGFVLAAPAAAHGRSTIDGKGAEWKGGELHIATAPAEVAIEE